MSLLKNIDKVLIWEKKYYINQLVFIFAFIKSKVGIIKLKFYKKLLNNQRQYFYKIK